MLLLALPIGFAIAGFLIGRWWVVLAAMATWLALAVFLYLNNGWFGAGWGDFGIELNVIIAVLTTLAAFLGVGVRRIATRSPARAV